MNTVTGENESKVYQRCDLCNVIVKRLKFFQYADFRWDIRLDDMVIAEVSGYDGNI